VRESCGIRSTRSDGRAAEERGAAERRRPLRAAAGAAAFVALLFVIVIPSLRQQAPSRRCRGDRLDEGRDVAAEQQPSRPREAAVAGIAVDPWRVREQHAGHHEESEGC
jgi:hypothetical protein